MADGFSFVKLILKREKIRNLGRGNEFNFNDNYILISVPFDLQEIILFISSAVRCRFEGNMLVDFDRNIARNG